MDTAYVNKNPNEDILKFHWHKYQHNKKPIDVAREDVEEILACQVYLHRNSIECIKYNYALEDIVQNFGSFKAFINLSQDSRYLKITNLKPINNPVVYHKQSHYPQ